MARVVSECRCGMSGQACLRASSSTWVAVSVGPLVQRLGLTEGGVL